MERIGTLIEKLQEQHAAGVDIDQLLLTAQLLEAELRYHRQVGVTQTPANGSAFLQNRLRPARTPESRPPEPAQRSPEPTPPIEPAHRVAEAAPRPPEPAPKAPAPEADHERYMPRVGAPAASNHRPAPAAVDDPPEFDSRSYNPINEVPTLAHQLPRDERRELNEIVGKTNGSSRNDLFKDQQRELSAALTDAPIRDLKKAIGINDRFVFISELFRGDEVMYERSVKTINNFGAYQEAHYWMERELKLKLAWDADKSSTKLFYQLVRRRFS